MPVVVTFVILIFIGTLCARQPDIDINRVKLIPRDRFSRPTPNNYHKRRSIIDINKNSFNNDYDYNSSGVTWLHTPLQFGLNAQTTTATKAPVKIYKPRQNPRDYYQSDAYVKKINRNNVDREVSSVYPGREVVRADDESLRVLPIRHFRRQLFEKLEDLDSCLRCPPDRTIIAKVGSDRVMLQYPHLQTCSGQLAPKNIIFKRLYGPRFGRLLKYGSYVIVGHITHGGRVLQTCKMQVHVLLQFCHIPKYLESHCEGEKNESCSFTCRDPKKKLQGFSRSTCGDDMIWNPNLPNCYSSSWCEPVPPPQHGRISCTGSTVENGFGLTEGSKCHLKCENGWKWRSRSSSICRNGKWTPKLECRQKKFKT